MPCLETRFSIGTTELDLVVEFEVTRWRPATRYSPAEHPNVIMTDVKLFRISGERVVPVPIWLQSLIETDIGLIEACFDAAN